jgi:hypothetical protein
MRGARCCERRTGCEGAMIGSVLVLSLWVYGLFAWARELARGDD